MNRLFAVTLLSLMMLASLALTAQTTVFKFNQDGEFASIDQSSDPSSSFSLSVSRNSSNGPNTAATASISFTASSLSADFSTFTFTQIVGTIPAAAFTGVNTQNLTLSLDVSQLDPTTSLSQTCTVDLNLLTVTCGAGPTGTIQLNFQENGAQRTRVLALGEEITVGNFTTRIHQRSDNSTANVSGTIFGTAVSASNATVGVNHNSSLEYVRNQ
ncbi:MAG TPA: hypothetical protein VKH81_23930 [Candidatus Angelobacter sp.]|nr:hypothetical protein [Candidatus Angelobacter sp.]